MSQNEYDTTMSMPFAIECDPNSWKKHTKLFLFDKRLFYVFFKFNEQAKLLNEETFFFFLSLSFTYFCVLSFIYFSFLFFFVFLQTSFLSLFDCLRVHLAPFHLHLALAENVFLFCRHQCFFFGCLPFGTIISRQITYCVMNLVSCIFRVYWNHEGSIMAEVWMANTHSLMDCYSPGVRICLSTCARFPMSSQQLSAVDVTRSTTSKVEKLSSE